MFFLCHTCNSDTLCNCDKRFFSVTHTNVSLSSSRNSGTLCQCDECFFSVTPVTVTHCVNVTNVVVFSVTPAIVTIITNAIASLDFTSVIMIRCVIILIFSFPYEERLNKL